MAKIAHLTSVHSRFDTRIFLKQCRSLAKAGHDVTLVVADGLGDAEREGVRILDAGKPNGRLDRMVSASRRVMRRGLDINAQIYHLHDPELLPVGIALKRKKKTVIFDAHEDVPKQILSKPYINPLMRRSISGMVGAFERFACKRFDVVLTATPAIREKFASMGIRAIDINNFPLLGELEAEADSQGKQNQVCYIGGISAIRGVREVVEAMGLSTTDARLVIGGKFVEKDVEAEVKGFKGWSRIDELGFLSREEVRGVLGKSIAGLVTFLPVPNHIDAQPNKMFEYMSAAVPVIASNFPLWREIIEGNDCGICVDPNDPQAIASAIDHLIANPEIVRRMGQNGRRAVVARYNWEAEEKRLLSLYSELEVETRS